MSLFESASLVVTPNGTKASKLYAIKPTDGSGDLSVTRATTATRVNSDGLIESVANNVPRLDYTNGSCPSILVEPQRTNLILRSEEFDNSSWTKDNATITANTVISPSGYQDADTLTDNSTNGRHRIFQTMSVTNGTTYTYSVFVKKNSSGRFLLINAASLINARAALNLDTLAVTNINGTGKVEDYGNGWYRFSVTGTATTTATLSMHIQMQNSASDVNYIGDGSSFYLWGAQFEAGANATSYIPTTTASVTRNADVISKTGISDLIGQTEGTMYAEVDIKNLGIPSRQIFNLTSGTANFLSLTFLSTNTLRFIIRANGGTQYNVSTSALPIGRYKLAGTYKAGELKLYVNGALIGTNTNASVSWSAALDRLNLDNSVLGNDNFSDDINLVSHWKTALTDEQCISLTTL